MLYLLPALFTVLIWPVPGAPPVETATSAAPAGVVRRDAATLLTLPDRRVRTTDLEIQELMSEGVRRSRTFASLLVELDSTDVIVYVERTKRLPSVIAARLLLVPVTHTQRYLRIQLGTGGTMDEAIALLAHELRHALEIAMAPNVKDDAALELLYRRIGENSIGSHAYDTREAQATGRTVKSELGG